MRDAPSASTKKKTVLILCTGNSCRSHIAEGVLRKSAGDFLTVESAGSHPAGFVHPLAIQVMAEIGIDISQHRSRHLNEFLDNNVSTVITVCDNAKEACPVFPAGVERLHWSFDDPAKARGSETERLEVFRDVRDKIRKRFEAYAQEERAKSKASLTRQISQRTS